MHPTGYHKCILNGGIVNRSKNMVHKFISPKMGFYVATWQFFATKLFIENPWCQLWHNYIATYEQKQCTYFSEIKKKL